MPSDITNDPVRLAIAICPLAAYLALIGIINLRRSPFVTSGGRDMLALSIGLSGLMTVGPLALVLPSWSVAAYGGYAWLMMIALYFLTVAFVILTRRPRIIAYNASIRTLRPLLREVADTLDPSARWAGESLFLPGLQMHLVMEEDYGTRNVQLKSIGPHQEPSGWRRLEFALNRAIQQQQRQRSNPYGYFLLGVGALMLVAVSVQVYLHGDFLGALLHELYVNS